MNYSISKYKYVINSTFSLQIHIYFILNAWTFNIEEWEELLQ